ncbi:uncharacterized protein LOC129615790, partial [Condylostylus longicornis]|uniref:uncharacterized protein LOC129615790 n=1 Tax=Condylostylus longicornis TaxID=2530218 RepID=UPI00244E335B
ASQYAIDAVLQQDSHPVCSSSRTLNEHERKYSATEKELLAIVWSTNYFRPYLYGVKFDLLTHHQPLKWLHSKTQGKDVDPRLYRWLLKLGEYNINIDYIKGHEDRRRNLQTNNQKSYEGLKRHIYLPNLKVRNFKVLFKNTLTIVTLVTEQNKFSKFATAFYLEDRNNQTILEKLREYKSQRVHFTKLETDNEFRSVNIKDFLRKENIEPHLVKPNSHTGNSDIERLHNTLSEKIRMLGIENKDLNIKEKIFRALEWYNYSYHSTTKGNYQDDRVEEAIEQDRNTISRKFNMIREHDKQLLTQTIDTDYALKLKV